MADEATPIETSERDCPPCDCNRRQRGGSHLQRCAILAWERRQIESARSINAND